MVRAFKTNLVLWGTSPLPLLFSNSYLNDLIRTLVNMRYSECSREPCMSSSRMAVRDLMNAVIEYETPRYVKVHNPVLGLVLR